VSDEVDRVLAAALDLPQDQRSEFIGRSCARDLDLQLAVMARLRAISPTDDFLERPAFVPAPHSQMCASGEVLAERFRIMRLIGRGGMGEVYEARDEELGSDVALKTIRAAIADDERAIETFRAEVLQARAVSHRNVCRVYDLFASTTDRGIVRFLTMELLSGTTLAERLRAAGPYPPEEALLVAQQIAIALDEAHRCGIVHRDLKPANIMLVDDAGSTRAVVMDFGLSISLASRGVDHDLAAGLPAGTEGYMAPELWGSDAVSSSADVYSFGVVLREMLTGWPSDLAEHGNDARVPKAWRRAIEACLQVDPLRRPPGASEVLRLIPGSPATRSRRRRLVVVGALLGMVALYASVSRLLTKRASEPVRTMVIADIANKTAEPNVVAVTEMLRYELAQSPVVGLLDPDQVNETLRQMVRVPGSPFDLQAAREVAWRRGADAVVSGQVSSESGGFVLSVRFERRTGRPDAVGIATTKSFEARDRTDLQREIREAADWVRLTSGESATGVPQADRPVEDVTSSSWEAVALFSRAQAFDTASRPDDALALLEEAVRLDPDFALAWMRLGDIRMSLRQEGEGYRDWRQALEAFHRRKLTPREEYRIRGLFASDTHDYAEAERVYRLYLLTYPGDFAPYFYIARPLLMLGRTDEAIQMLQQARQRESTSLSAMAQLAMFDVRAGRFDDAAVEIAHLRESGHTEWADCIQAQKEFLAGDYAAALRGFGSLEHATDTQLRMRAPALEAAVLAELGRTEAAIGRLRQGVQADQALGDQPDAADKLLALASLYLQLGQRHATRDACIESRQLGQSLFRTAQAAALLARAGFPGDAEDVLADLPADSPSRQVRLDRLRVTGEIQLARHQPTAAWRSFQGAAALEAPGVYPEYLARGAVAAGEEGTALSLYERMGRDPGYYWRYPDSYPPGAWVDALRSYSQILPRSAGARSDPMLLAQLRRLTTNQLPADAK
jgi:serine/threonine protein kinase/tetratricopeptide (TPR) repeat protein